MRKLFVVLMAVMMAVSASANLSFLGAEMSGTLETFNKVVAVRNAGLTYYPVEGKPNWGSFSGTIFDSPYQSIVYTIGSPVTHTIYQVAILQLFSSNGIAWSELKSIYNDFKNQLTKLYGTPNYDEMEFTAPYSEYNHPIDAIMAEKVTIATTYLSGDGTISLRMGLAPNSDKIAIEAWFTDYTGYQIDQSEKSK